MLKSSTSKVHSTVPAASVPPSSRDASVSSVPPARTVERHARALSNTSTARRTPLHSLPNAPTTRLGANVRQDESHENKVSSHTSARQPDALVIKAQNGDREAFTALFRRHRSAVAAIAYRMLGPTADLEDVVQEVFLQVHRSLPHFRAQAKFSTWLHRVAGNDVLMTRRRAKSRPAYTFEDTPRHEPDLGPLPDQHLDKLRRQRAFHRLLDKLSDKKRVVFMLHELEGMKPADIAKQVGCPILTVRTRLFYARRELCELMKHEPSLSMLLSEQSDGAPARKGGRRRKADDRRGEAQKGTRSASKDANDVGDGSGIRERTPETSRVEGESL